MLKFAVIAGVFGFLGVLLGAFGAHGLEERLSSNGHIDTWETATLYLFVHALAVLATASLGNTFKVNGLHKVAGFWVAGVVLFSGSLYVLALTNVSKLGMITPLGGLCFLIGWALLVWNVHSTWKTTSEITQI
jgi:uncharacterized membrane protein YgdD (TMEM256/DUF423 family)